MSETRTSEYLQKLENKVRELEAEKLEIAKSCISCRKEFRETLAKAQADVLKERELTAKMQLEFSKSLTLTPADARAMMESCSNCKFLENFPIKSSGTTQKTCDGCQRLIDFFAKKGEDVSGNGTETKGVSEATRSPQRSDIERKTNCSPATPVKSSRQKKSEVEE